MSLLKISLRIAATFAILLLAAVPACSAQSQAPQGRGHEGYVGFDRNEYPGDSALPSLRKYFRYSGYWLTSPPGAHRNGWSGKRALLLREGFGFLVLANGKLDREIKSAHATPESLGRTDGTAAAAAARREGFPERTILFLDQEEGGRLLPEQMAYLLAWTEAVATANYLPGLYASGQPVSEGPSHITTVQDVRAHVAARHLHEVAMWVYEDACPPAPGCTLTPPPLTASGTPGALVWQYAQSPRRPGNTAACARTYAPDGNCYGGEGNHLLLDLNVAASPDPSNGR